MLLGRESLLQNMNKSVFTSFTLKSDFQITVNLSGHFCPCSILEHICHLYNKLIFQFNIYSTRKRIVSKAIRVKKAISIADLASSVFDDLCSYQKAISNCKKKVRLSLTLDMEKMSECLWHFTCKKGWLRYLYRAPHKLERQNLK